jgi:hypothetical protein
MMNAIALYWPAPNPARKDTDPEAAGGETVKVVTIMVVGEHLEPARMTIPTTLPPRLEASKENASG